MCNICNLHVLIYSNIYLHMYSIWSYLWYYLFAPYVLIIVLRCIYLWYLLCLNALVVSVLVVICYQYILLCSIILWYPFQTLMILPSGWNSSLETLQPLVHSEEPILELFPKASWILLGAMGQFRTITVGTSKMDLSWGSIWWDLVGFHGICRCWAHHFMGFFLGLIDWSIPKLGLAAMGKFIGIGALIDVLGMSMGMYWETSQTWSTRNHE